ncbi:MAG: tRNA pseudouridine(38-40) synthase TruA [Akkermansiaceae bacterium]
MRLKLTISYDGRPYLGWQSQSGGNTVQDLLHQALKETSGRQIKLHAAGRTDTGVHAFAQVAHFDIDDPGSMNPYNWVPALNTKLPATIRVTHCEEVSTDFHSRFFATGKSYFYDVCTEPVLPPLKAGLAWHLPRLLDAQALNDSLKLFEGKHDFHAFAAYRGNEQEDTDYHRTIFEANVMTLPDGYRLVFHGDGFLYKMVRMLVGSAIKAAQGRLRIDDLQSLLDQPQGLPNGKAPLCAPPDGLVLEKVFY